MAGLVFCTMAELIGPGDKRFGAAPELVCLETICSVSSSNVTWIVSMICHILLLWIRYPFQSGEYPTNPPISSLALSLPKSSLSFVG